MALVERTHETMLIQAPVAALREAMRHADGLGRLDIQVEGEKKARKAIVKHVEHDPMKHQLIHVTLQEISEDDMVKIDVPVFAQGEPAAMETEDLMLMQVTDHIKVHGRMSSLPERIDVDVTGLLPGHHISSSDIELPEGVNLISSPDATLFSLRSREQATAEAPTEEVVEEEATETPEEA